MFQNTIITHLLRIYLISFVASLQFRDIHKSHIDTDAIELSQYSRYIFSYQIDQIVSITCFSAIIMQILWKK